MMDRATFEEVFDLDWFALDACNSIGHFATGGCGAMPTHLADLQSEIAALLHFFQSESPLSGEAEISSQALDQCAGYDNDRKTWFLRDFLGMARRGLYSYDTMSLSKRPSGYYLIASPVIPQSLHSLPLHLQKIIERTRLENVVFSRYSNIEAASIV